MFLLDEANATLVFFFLSNVIVNDSNGFESDWSSDDIQKAGKLCVELKDFIDICKT